MSLTNARITGNVTGDTAAANAPDGNAGGICNTSSGSVSLTNVEISGNKSAGVAGGMFVQGSSVTVTLTVTLTNVTISGNEARTSGGTVSNESTSAEDNGGGGGIFFYSGSSDYFNRETVKIRNSIIWGNGSPDRNIAWYNPSSPPSFSFGSSAVRYYNTLVERPVGNGESGIVSGIYNAAVLSGLGFSGSAAEIFAGPLPSQAPATALPGAYKLKSLGIWINGGDNSLYTAVSGPPEDFAGADRPRGSAIDLGAYEKQ
jgi:hypothetical protein